MSQRQIAVALGYDDESMQAPKVLAKGGGVIAEKILSLAQEQGVPVHRDANLAYALHQIEVGLHIPEKLYPVIAELFAYLMQMEKGLESTRPKPFEGDQTI